MAPRPGTEILEVMMPMFSGSKDEYGKDVVPAVPLSFDRVNEGRPPRTNARLFKLPFEILGVILGYINSDSLSALALVNHDCLQLARSRQFVSIHLDYSDTSLGIIEKLLSELKQRSANPGVNPSPSLGVCIRRMTVATHPGWITHRHGVSLGGGEFENLSEEEQNRRMVDASQAFFGTYIPNIGAVINKSTTPHLELLDWEDMISLPQSFYNFLALSPIKYLKLFRVKVDSEFIIELPEAFQFYHWPLRTLHLELLPQLGKYNELSTSPLSASILRLCAPSLESLFLEAMPNLSPYTFLNGHSDNVPVFPSLRNLNFGMVRFKDPSMLQALVTDSLRTLNVDWEKQTVMADFFQHRGRIPSLETLACESTLSADHPLDFIRANPQLLKLALPQALPSQLLEFRLLPLLSQSFSKLKSLSLVWEGTDIPESAIETIGSLKTLEQLHLSTGEQFGWRHDWPIKHDVMRKHLSQLPCLKKLAFSRDSYTTEHTGFPLTHYYEIRLLFGDDAPDDPNDNDRLWERHHRRRMAGEAIKYVSVMTNLEWLYFGQIPMRISRIDMDGSTPVISSHQERDSCWTLLRKMFGGATYE